MPMLGALCYATTAYVLTSGTPVTQRVVSQRRVNPAMVSEAEAKAAWLAKVPPRANPLPSCARCHAALLSNALAFATPHDTRSLC